MKEPLIERIKQWICAHLWHKLEGKSWVGPHGDTFDCCKRCSRIITIKEPRDPARR